jgi:DNA segregation ATPase FtsK/SpoIIIE, S-DNA-T family
LSDQLTLATERQLLRTLLERVSLRSAAEQEIETTHASEVATEQQQYQSVFQLLTENYDSERIGLDQNRETQLAEVDRVCQARSAAIQLEYRDLLSVTEDRFKAEKASAEKERDEAVWLVSSLLDDDSEGSPLQRLQLTESAVAAAEIELKTGIQSLDSGYEKVVSFLKRSHMWSEPPEVESTISRSNPDAMKSACLSAISAGEPLKSRITGRVLPRLFIGIVPLLLFLVITAGLFGVIWGFINPAVLQLKLKSTDRDWLVIAAGVSAAVSLLSMFFVHLYASHRTLPDYEDLVQQRVNAHFAFSVWEKTSKTELNMLEAECSHLHEQRVKRRDSALAGAASKHRTRTVEAERIYNTTLQRAHATFPTRLNEVETQRTSQRAAIEQKYQADSQDMVFRRESDFQKLQSEFDARMAGSRQRYQQTWIELIRAWQTDLANFGRVSDSLCAAANDICPTWDIVAADQRPYPEISPPVLSLGRIEADLDMVEGGLSANPRLKADRQRFDVPVLLPLHERPSLVLNATGKGRDVAVKTLQSTMLRFLTSLPPGKVRFTIVDPVGLGANFAAFMHLADIDELLVSSRIWTEPSHIEKRLADLTEHMETVLQTYLRNEFATIDEYNHFAGEVAEPYRVLVIANFPVNFTDIALRRLASIADGGSRCGVYLMMSFDKSQELPRGFSAADLEKHATVLQWTEDGFHLTDSDLGAWPLALDAPPPAEEFGHIVRLAGQHARDVRRVEVPFERVAPNADQFWESDSRKGIDVPVGRAGATKLQSLRLGKGTSQHVLIAGKTGSGKSTLLHALITNLALYYSPAEVEFYLIDFKKGVEFKVYAEQRLPHARVIAIESDREFGVSVLERLDALLRDRGELFREAGVQDIAGFRDARPDVVMPRTLLLVDEFQEFFIEDDALSQQASLFLDRLIRQGRAFGVHILLGSQTLAGAYSLARSTLGQVAVRIALQCSETDAHLILSEENTAARLLTRPGEAIYNDANGLIEGNHPFQVVWLGEEERAGYLKTIREEASGQGSRGRCTDEIQKMSLIPPLVFEGNIPADPTINRRLQRVIAKSKQAVQQASGEGRSAIDSPWTCWLGDSVSLGGPLELSFGLREGSNVLIVGRDDKASLGVMATSALALGAQAVSTGTNSTTIYVLDGSLPNADSAQSWRQLTSVWKPAETPAFDGLGDPGQVIRVISPKETATVINEIIVELHRRADEPGPPVFLYVYDLARFRDLRKSEDDFGFTSGSDKGANTAQLFSEILREGPAVGIFTLAWVDSYQTAQRWLARDQMNRFEYRVLFAMNANDSSSLVDSPLAGRLGENRALLYRGDTGTLEKFRPFSTPTSGWLNQLALTVTRVTPFKLMQGSGALTGAPSVIVADNSDNMIEPCLPDRSVDLPNIDDLKVE